MKAIGHPGHPPLLNRTYKKNALDGMGEVNLMFFRLYSATSLEVCELNSHLYQQLVCLFGNVLMPVSNPSNYYSAENFHWVIQ